MDVKRNLLILGLAVVSYLMLLAWREDYAAPAEAAVAAAALPDIPQNTPGPAGASASVDVPQVQTPGQTPAPTNTPAASLIVVSTPSQLVTIDPVGGDIVEIDLPRFPTSIETPDDPFPMMYNDNRGVYVAQSGLAGVDGPDRLSRLRYNAAQTRYSLEEGTLIVDLVATAPNDLQITKRLTFTANDYLIDVQHIVTNNGSTNRVMNLFAQVKRDNQPDPSNVRGLGRATFLGAVMTTPDDPYEKIKLADLEKGREPFTKQGGWIGFSQHYFLGSWIAPADATNSFSIRRNSAGEYLIGFTGADVSIPPGQTATIASALWAGPKDQYRLEEISPNLGLTIDYGMLWFVGQPIFWLLTQINALVGNYGLAIVLLTCVIRLIMYPLSAKQFRSQAALKRIQPKIAQLKERYGEDKQKFMQAQMELWKKEGANPFGGCLPVFLQMPVFLGIYWVLNESVELRQASFILWYKDLSMGDPYFVLPLLLGAAYYLQQHMTPMMTTDPMQEKVMKFMPVIFCFFFLWFPAGLVLYYLANSLLGILQQWWFNHSSRTETVPAAND
jgi:YidC/Oxa1 family membrane protein insertase